MSDRPPVLTRFMRPIVQLRDGEAGTVFLMFLYSFLAMTSYNIAKPISRSQFISSLGADNLPYVQLGMGILVGFIMQAYVKSMALVPRRWTIPVTQAGLTSLLVIFWVLFTTISADWVPVVFYILTLILGILLISQFWTLANDIYDPRQAKRVFGFVGAGASLGGVMGGGLTRFLVESVGTRTMLLISAAMLAACLAIVMLILRRDKSAGTSDAAKAGVEEGVGGSEALKLLGSSRHLQVIAFVIAFAAIGAAIIEQQLNMATAEAKGAANTDAMTAFLAQIGVYTSLIGFVIQVALTSRIHRVMGIAFALLVLPVSLGTTGLIMLFNRGLWAPSLARVLDTSLRYTVDKTSREVLFLPLPADLKYRAKPFIDVTVDRVSKGLGALIILVLIKPWGFNFNWQQLSYASLTMVALWVVTSLRARKEYLRTFRRNLDEQHVAPDQVRFTNPDPATVETLVSELAHHEPRRVLYAIDLLDAMDKRPLVTPLLLWHDSPEIRARALNIAEAAGPDAADRWLPGVQRALTDPDTTVRVAAVAALAALRGQDAADVMRPLVSSPDPALSVVAAAALADSDASDDVALADATLRRYADDARDQGVRGRLQVARAAGDIRNPAFRALLVPLMHDANIDVARAAIQSAEKVGAGEFLFVPPLVALLRHRQLKSVARQALVSYGEPVVAPLAYFMRDQDEDVWIRRHVPSALAALPYPSSVEALVAALDDPDAFLRSKAVVALGRLRAAIPDATIDPAVVARQVSLETARAFDALTLHYNLFVAAGLSSDSLLARALTERHDRGIERTFRLLDLIAAPGDMPAIRQTLRSPDQRSRSGAIEYLDNLLSGQLRKRVMVLVEEAPLEEKIRKGNAIFSTRRRDVEDTVAQLLHDADESIAAAAILLVETSGLWSLSDDLEYVLAHRDVRDQHVFEAASWALPAGRMAAERRRDLWQEALPSVVLVDRFRHVALFDFMSVDDLFALARLGRQVRYEPGRILYEPEVPPSSLQVLLDGQVSYEGPDGSRDLTAPGVLAFEEILEGARMRGTVATRGRAITMAVTQEEFLTLLAESPGLVGGLFRQVAHARGLGDGHTVTRGDLTREPAAVTGGYDRPVDRLLALQESRLLAHATTDELWSLAHIARPATLPAGATLLAPGEEFQILVVLAGSVQAGGPETNGPARAGDLVGVYETLTGKTVAGAASVVEPATVLRIRRGELLDLLADHTSLLQGLFSELIRQSGNGGPKPSARHGGVV